eukprot:5932577-Amphidinium_carterae.2
MERSSFHACQHERSLEAVCVTLLACVSILKFAGLTEQTSALLHPVTGTCGSWTSCIESIGSIAGQFGVA